MTRNINNTTNFYKFPKTPHLKGSSTVDDDEVLPLSSILDSFTVLESSSSDQDLSTLLIQEKIDGTNVSVHFEHDWLPICQKRSGIIQKQNEKQQYNVFRSWVDENLEVLWNTLKTKFILFGEFLWYLLYKLIL